VIPFKFRSDRIIPLRRIVDFINGFQGAEVVIVEQDSHSKISHLNLRAKHIFLKSDLPFNKSWAFNVALRKLIAPVVIFADADFLISPNDLIESLKTLESFDCVIPTSNIVSLNPQESAADLNQIFTIKRSGFKTAMSNGCVLFKKESIQKIGGWNEDFIGVSQENQFQDIKISKLLNFKQLDFTGYHLFHHQDMLNPVFMQRNNQIMEVYKEGNIDSLYQHIYSTSPKIGWSNKYSSL
jgi:glycosyltransferase involved in cell wall biosynthesis